MPKGARLYWRMLKRRTAYEDFLAVLENGTPEAKCFALCGIREIILRDFDKISAPYLDSRDKVRTCHNISASIIEESIGHMTYRIMDGKFQHIEPPKPTGAPCKLP